MVNFIFCAVNMAGTVTFSNQQTLLATGKLFNVDIVVITTTGSGGSHGISLSKGSPLPTLFIGHFAKDNGM